MANSIQVAGDVNIDSVKITTAKGFHQVITNQVIGIQLFEDIFSPFMTGTLTIKDSLDLINAFPFIGEEFLELKISTPDLQVGNIDNKFYISKMTNREIAGDRAVIYDLHFISVEFLGDLNKKISKTFAGKCSDIVNTLLTDDVNGLNVTKKIQVEETLNSTTFISNYWSPIKNINYLSDASVNKNHSPTYLFFESRNGFNFVSLESLYLENAYQQFKFDNFTRDIQSNGSSSRNIEEGYKRIKELKMPVGFDYIQRTREGLYGSRMYSYDITTKQFRNTVYSMWDTYGDQQHHLNENPIASSRATNRPDANILTLPKYTENYTGWGDVTNVKTVQKRMSLMAQLNASKLEILVPGRCDYTVGMKVELNLTKVEPIKSTDTDIEDEMFSGYYIVSAINHIISNTTHECNMELVKDSLIKNLDR